jgi:hypothetical protein
MKLLLLLFLMMCFNSIASNTYIDNKLEVKDTINVQLIIKLDGERLDSALVEINGLKFISDSNGLINLKIETGVYELKITKDEHIQLFDVTIGDKTGFIILDIKT